MREAWLAEQDRRRRREAALYTAAAYALAFLAAWGFGFLRTDELAEFPGAVLVSLDSGDRPGGSPLGRELAPERPAEAPAASPAPPPQEAKAPAAPAKAAPAPAAAPAAPKAAAAPAAPSSAAGLLPKEQKAAAATPSPQPAPVERSAPPRSFGSPIAEGTPAGVAGGSGSVTYRGSEQGNALDTVLGASSGTAGRILYAPIYGYMPLPSRVPASIYEAIPADKAGYFPAEARKKTFLKYYQVEGDVLRLKEPVKIDQRQGLWLMLEEAGYDLASADYKDAVKNRVVVIEFVLSNTKQKDKGGKPEKVELVEVSLVSGSGSAEVDEAVLYGFKKATYFNQNDHAIEGKFSYRFGK